MTAPTLFDVDATVRHSDPETSRAAAAGDRTTLELDVLSAVRAAGWAGATTDEVTAAIGGKARHNSVARRLTTLRRSGRIDAIGTRTGESGKQQTVYRAIGHLGGLR